MEKTLQLEETEPKDELVLLENLEIEPLSDEDLEDVTGGFCSFWCCSVIVVDPNQNQT